MLNFSLKTYKNAFGSLALHRPARRAYNARPDALAGFFGGSRGEGREGKRR